MSEGTIEQVLSGSATWCVEHGDCLEVLRRLPEGSVDSAVTDPPSGIGFMGAEWDDDQGGMDEWVNWLEDRTAELLRVLKPGGYALVWSLPRTSHWTALALERAGFWVIDTIDHVFGTGFPKSVNASKAIDNHDFRQWLHLKPDELALHRKTEARCKELKGGFAMLKGGSSGGGRDSRATYARRLRKRVERMQRRRAGLVRQVVKSYMAGGNAGTPTDEKGGTFVTGAPNSKAVELTKTIGATERSREWDGYGTGLKPAKEVWWLVQKPFKATIAENLLENGTGAMNLDACRVPTDWSDRPDSWHKSGNSAKPDADKIAAPPGEGINCHPDGREPANLVLSHNHDCGEHLCTEGCPVRVMGEQSGDCSKIPGFTRGASEMFGVGAQDQRSIRHTDSGTAARYFYQFRPESEDEWESVDLNRTDQTDTTSPKKGTSGVSTTGDSECSTTSSGNSTTGQSQTATKSTTRTKTSRTTESKTLNYSTPPHTSGSTGDVNSETESGGNRAPYANTANRSPVNTGTSQKKGGRSTVVADLATLERRVNEAPPFVYMAKPSTGEREAGLDAFEARTGGEATKRIDGDAGIDSPRAGAGRGGGRRNVHTTVKSRKLMAYLMRLVTPKGGVCVDLFAGSGSGGVAAVHERIRWIGIELNDTDEEPFVRLARARIRHAERAPEVRQQLLFDLGGAA